MLYRLTTLIAIGVSVSGQPHPVGQGVNFYSKEKEAALGASLAKDTRSRTTPIDSPRVQAYVERLGTKLAAQLPDTGSPTLLL